MVDYRHVLPHPLIINHQKLLFRRRLPCDAELLQPCPPSWFPWLRMEVGALWLVQDRERGRAPSPREPLLLPRVPMTFCGVWRKAAV